jgi:hypothetical protein
MAGRFRWQWRWLCRQGQARADAGKAGPIGPDLFPEQNPLLEIRSPILHELGPEPAIFNCAATPPADRLLFMAVRVPVRGLKWSVHDTGTGTPGQGAAAGDAGLIRPYGINPSELSEGITAGSRTNSGRAEYNSRHRLRLSHAHRFKPRSNSKES